MSTATLSVGQRVRVVTIPDGWESALSVGDQGAVTAVDPDFPDHIFVALDDKPLPELVQSYLASEGVDPGWPLDAHEVEPVE